MDSFNEQSLSELEEENQQKVHFMERLMKNSIKNNNIIPREQMQQYQKTMTQLSSKDAFPKYDAMNNASYVNFLKSTQRNFQRLKLVMYSLLMGLIVLNNIFSILIFVLEQYITDKKTELAIDIVVIVLYLMEFIYNFVTFPPPKSAFFCLYFTWVDIVTMITPMISFGFVTKSEDHRGLTYIKIVRILRVSKVIRIIRLAKMIKRYTIFNS